MRATIAVLHLPWYAMLGPTLAIVPLRGTGKTRLAAQDGGGGLDPRERAILSSAMLSDVISALRGAPLDNIVVAASDGTAAAVAHAIGTDVVRDPPGSDLNDAIEAAVHAIPCETLLVVTADLPCVTTDDLTEVLSKDAQVVVGPTGDGGTSALLRRPPIVIPTAYGRGSAARHLDLAREAGVPSAVVDRPGFRADVDTWEDLKALVEAPVGRSTARFLEHLAPRLEHA